MGMFDSLYDDAGREWQTKAFDCNLDEYRIGDSIEADSALSFQVEVISGVGTFPNYSLDESFATFRDGVLVSVGDERDDRLVLVGYSGGIVTDRALAARQPPIPAPPPS